MPSPDRTAQYTVEALAQLVGHGMWQSARTLRDIQDIHPKLFPKVVDELEIGPVPARTLADFCRRFDEFGVAPARLDLLSWTTRILLERNFNGINGERLVALAEQLPTTWELREALARAQ